MTAFSSRLLATSFMLLSLSTPSAIASITPSLSAIALTADMVNGQWYCQSSPMDVGNQVTMFTQETFTINKQQNEFISEGFLAIEFKKVLPIVTIAAVESGTFTLLEDGKFSITTEKVDFGVLRDPQGLFEEDSEMVEILNRHMELGEETIAKTLLIDPKSWRYRLDDGEKTIDVACNRVSH